MQSDSKFHEMIQMEQGRRALSNEEKDFISTIVNKRLSEYPEVRFAFLHGSFLENLPSRDIDIAVYFDPRLDSETILDLTLKLSVEITSSIHIQADVHALNLANNDFRYHATQGQVVLSRDDEETFGFIENTWLAFMDFHPLARQILSDLAD
ncbi:MAG: nucleotidyltransferase domain-containing protein [Syntrophothermus sp.]|uniref:nucleotidyltransferase domain-containing protein n=1 Tax=Syntrophothermus sp. TaxID=2736299 RepID=UPI00257CCBD5|nr:nucleotidyltransferase domain-containing protein [Syntrophothermus sp.]NSW83211.1 nucleotidyltransferase domain-containing protein [Syntrophothermus sp.]